MTRRKPEEDRPGNLRNCEISQVLLSLGRRYDEATAQQRVLERASGDLKAKVVPINGPNGHTKSTQESALWKIADRVGSFNAPTSHTGAGTCSQRNIHPGQIGHFNYGRT